MLQTSDRSASALHCWLSFSSVFGLHQQMANILPLCVPARPELMKVMKTCDSGNVPETGTLESEQTR